MKKLLFIPFILLFNICFAQDKVVLFGDGSFGGNWGTIGGVLSNQTDLQNALNLKVNLSDSTVKYVTPTQLASDITTITVDYPIVALSPIHLSFSSTYVDSLVALLLAPTTVTELGYVHGVTSSIQTQINALTTGLNYAQLTYINLGGSIKAEPITGNGSMATSNFSLTSQQIIRVVVYLPTSGTITGVKFHPHTAGSFTPNNYNGIAVYSISGGTETYIDETANDATIWTSAGGTSMVSRTFGTTHVLPAGNYAIYALYCSSAQTTAPGVNAFPSAAHNSEVSMDFANSQKLYAILSGQTAMPTPTQAASGLTTVTAEPYFALY